MKKSIKKLISIIAATLCFTSLFFVTACGGGSGNSGGNGSNESAAPSTGKTLKIKAVQLGYGTKWLDAIAKEWENKTGNKVVITTTVGTSGNDSISNEIQSHASDQDIFLYRTADYAKRVYEGEIKAGGKTYPNVFMDITDVCKKELDGEGGASIDSKINENMRNLYTIDGKYYGLPWIEGAMGIMRNRDVWESCGLTDADTPLTTDQLFAVCDKIKAKGVSPFIYSGEDEYYSSFMGAWFMQYESEENVKNYLEGKDPTGAYSKNLFTYQGHIEMLKVLEKLLKKTNGYQRDNDLTFTDMQGYFLLGQAAFCVNGAWIELEMGGEYKESKIDYIKTPVVSALANELSFGSESSSDKEAKLIELIKYVDGTVAEKPSYATDEDVARVKKARKCNYVAQGASHALVGSSLTKNPDLVRSFIEYMYSDKGMDCYYRSTNGASLPFNLSPNGKYSDIELSDFQKEVNKIKKDEIVVFASNAKMYSLGGVSLKLFNGTSGFINEFYKGDSNAQKVINSNNDFMKDNWARISQSIK